MKRILVIPVMIIYLIAMSGLMIHAHYCGQELESWNVYEKTKGCADGACGDESEKNDDCCKDKVVNIKISQDQNTVASFQLKLTVPVGAEPAAFYSNLVVSPLHAYAILIAANQPNAPPGRTQLIPLYKLHSSFIYYG